MELPTKREAESAEAEAASKKARTRDEVISGNDGIMSDTVSEQDEEASMQTDGSTTEETGSDDESMPDIVPKQGTNRRWTKDSDDEFMFPDSLAKHNVDIVREFQIFFQSQGYSDRAKEILSEKHAHKLFTEVEMDKFMKINRTKNWQKNWHIRPALDGQTDYERMSIYPSNDSYNFFCDYCLYSFPYDFDLAYLKFAEELWANIKWDTTESDAWTIAEAIWKKHMPEGEAVQLCLVDDCISGAVFHSRAKQSAKEMASLCYDLYKCEMDGEDPVQALNEIIAEKGLECYPRNKALIEEALEKCEGRLWSKYHFMKSNCKFENREALDENKLKSLITRYFEAILESLSQDHYVEYVKEKIRNATELGIL